jgi:hypothetical protein
MIWAALGSILLGLDASPVNISVAAQWFPITSLGPQGSINTTIDAFSVDDLFSQMMFPCSQAYFEDVQDTRDDGDGFTCWINIASNPPSTSVTTSQVMALLNAASIRAQVAASISGGVALDILPVTSLYRIVSFDSIATAAQDDYTKKKSYFAAGLIATLVVVIAVLAGLWVWTGSGRTMG